MRLFKRGSSEIVAIVLLIVVLGGLAIAVSGTVSKQTRENTNAGLNSTTQKFEETYNSISSQIK